LLLFYLASLSNILLPCLTGDQKEKKKKTLPCLTLSFTGEREFGDSKYLIKNSEQLKTKKTRLPQTIKQGKKYTEKDRKT